MAPRSNDDNDAGDNRPITTNSLIRWGGAAITVGSVVLGLTWKLSDLGSTAAVQGNILTNNAVRIADVDKQSLTRHEQQEHEIEQLQRKADTLEARLNEMDKKVTECVTILRRMDPGKP